MRLPQPIQQLDDALAGWPDMILTLTLFGLALVLVAAALFAPRLVKAGVAAWVILP